MFYTFITALSTCVASFRETCFTRCLRTPMLPSVLPFTAFFPLAFDLPLGILSHLAGLNSLCHFPAKISNCLYLAVPLTSFLTFYNSINFILSANFLISPPIISSKSFINITSNRGPSSDPHHHQSQIYSQRSTSPPPPSVFSDQANFGYSLPTHLGPHVLNSSGPAFHRDLIKCFIFIMKYYRT